MFRFWPSWPPEGVVVQVGGVDRFVRLGSIDEWAALTVH
jgi:hypothetical protein